VRNTLTSFYISIGRSVHDRVGLEGLLPSVTERGDAIILFSLHVKHGSFVGSVHIGHLFVATFFLERTPVVGSGSLFTLRLGFDKSRSGVLVLLHSGREGVSLGISMLLGCDVMACQRG
jgi:hypothetical protein